MNTLELRNISKKFHGVVIADSMNLQIRENTFSVIFGAPGSGKSTLLRLITGLEGIDKGDILLHNQVITGVKPGDRNIGYVPQSFALYPHYSVFDNIAYPLKLMGVKTQHYTPVVERAAERLQITHLLKKRPDQCSGGEKQRVAIARGIVKDTRVFILDDPLTGLDFKLRERLFDDLRQMREDLKATFIYTTSDPLEALMLAEDIHVFDAGKIVESGTINEVYRTPKHLRTISLLGFPNTNTLRGTLAPNGGTGATCTTSIFNFPAHVSSTLTQNRDVVVALRPQDIAINPASKQGMVTFPGVMTLVEDLGGEMHVYLDVSGVEMEAVVPRHEAGDLTEGETLLGVRTDSFKVFGADDQTFIGQGVS